MENPLHSVKELFEQLGLQADVEAIEEFLAEKTPLRSGVLLTKASFWTSAQRAFLEEEMLRDADWVSSIDLLNILLSKK